MYTIRIYCGLGDKKHLTRYERSETQIIRLKENNKTHIRFKMYDYCNSYYDSNRSFSWLIHNTPNNRFVPNTFANNSNITSISVEIKDNAGTVVYEAEVEKMIGGKFDLMIPSLTRGSYTLIVTYETTEGDKIAKTFPLVITT